MSDFSYDDVLHDLRRAYDAQVAARDRSPLSPWNEPLREQFLARLQAENRRTLVELGAGPGMRGRYFADAGIDVVCTDLSPAMVEACRAKGLQAIATDFLQLLARLPHPIDAAFAMNCLLHAPPPDLPRVLKAVHDVLEPEGLLPDARLRALAEVDFRILEFQVVEVPGEEEPGFHFQALVLRRA